MSLQFVFSGGTHIISLHPAPCKCAVPGLTFRRSKSCSYSRKVRNHFLAGLILTNCIVSNHKHACEKKHRKIQTLQARFLLPVMFVFYGALQFNNDASSSLLAQFEYLRAEKSFSSRGAERHREEVRIFHVWWGKVDSNHRSYKQQIYSLSPLATREFPQICCSCQNSFIIACFWKMSRNIFVLAHLFKIRERGKVGGFGVAGGLTRNGAD